MASQNQAYTHGEPWNPPTGSQPPQWSAQPDPNTKWSDQPAPPPPPQWSTQPSPPPQWSDQPAPYPQTAPYPQPAPYLQPAPYPEPAPYPQPAPTWTSQTGPGPEKVMATEALSVTEPGLVAGAKQSRPVPVWKKKWFIRLAIAILVVIVIAVGAGAGVGSRKHSSSRHSYQDDGGSSSCVPPGGQECETAGDCFNDFSSCITACDGFSYCT